MGSHSIIPPSSAHIWGAPNGCTGWVLMSQQFPEQEETPEAAEGTASHEIGSGLIMNQAVGRITNNPPDFVDKTASNGVIYTQEMFEAAEIYANDVGEVMRSTAVFGGPNFGNEQKIKMPKIHELNEGTPDQFIFDGKTGNLYVWDYKFGFEVVEVFENWQLIDYTEGVLELLEVNGIADQHVTVHMRVIQPRAHHRDGIIREWVVKASDLRAHFNTLHMNAAISLSNDSVCNTGTHCKHCVARHACGPAIQAGMGMFEVLGKPVPLTMSPAAKGAQLTLIKRARKHLESLESGFEEEIKHEIRSGTDIPGWLVQMGQGHEKWIKPAEEVATMGDLMGFDVRKPLAVKTPTQVRQLGIDDSVIKEYSIKPNTGLKIVPDNGSKAKLLFGEIKS